MLLLASEDVQGLHSTATVVCPCALNRSRARPVYFSCKQGGAAVALCVASKYFLTVAANEASMLSHLVVACTSDGHRLLALSEAMSLVETAAASRELGPFSGEQGLKVWKHLSAVTHSDTWRAFY